jgi:hypothetical protein
VFDFLPNIDSFYKDWLGRPLSGEDDYKDLTYSVTRTWADEL